MYMYVCITVCSLWCIFVMYILIGDLVDVMCATVLVTVA